MPGRVRVGWHTILGCLFGALIDGTAMIGPVRRTVYVDTQAESETAKPTLAELDNALRYSLRPVWLVAGVRSGPWAQLSRTQERCGRNKMARDILFAALKRFPPDGEFGVWAQGQGQGQGQGCGQGQPRENAAIGTSVKGSLG